MNPEMVPVCPYCGGDPMVLASCEAKVGALRLLITFCGNAACRKTLNTHVVEVERQLVSAGLKGVPSLLQR